VEGYPPGLTKLALAHQQQSLPQIHLRHS
jgi:hypothetical protein